MRRMGSTAIGVVLLLSLLSGPVSAGGACTYDAGFYMSGDYAWTERMSGTCTGVKARHKYDPVWSQYNYWTPWAYDSYFASSLVAAELFDHQHGYWNEA